MTKRVKLILCLAAFSTHAETVTMWRGETRAVRLPDSVETPFVAPAGVSLRFGALKPVRYALGNQAQPKALLQASVADRVEWDGGGEGHRVVEITVPADLAPGHYALGPQNELVVLDRTDLSDHALVSVVLKLED